MCFVGAPPLAFIRSIWVRARAQELKIALKRGFIESVPFFKQMPAQCVVQLMQFMTSACLFLPKNEGETVVRFARCCA